MRKTIMSVSAEFQPESKRVVLRWRKAIGFTERGLAEDGEFSKFRIHRRTETDFEFGVDYEEFFLNSPRGDMKPVFEEPLPAVRDVAFEWFDTDIEFGAVYSYFIETAKSAPAGPFPVRVRDPKVWWPADYVYERARDAAKRHGKQCRMEICGKTLEGRDIPCLICGNAKKYILLAGAVHAGESGPELILPVAEYMLEKNPDFLKKTGIIAVPSLNIDMRERLVKGVPWYLRLNAAGVDLNRNFPTGWDKVDFSYGLDSSERGAATYRGPSPFSEPETRALMSAAENFKITAAFSFHALASICGLPALMPRKAERDSVYNESCKKIISAFAEGFYPGEVYQERWLYHGTSGGSFPEWLYDIAGIPAFDFEAGADQTWLPARTDKTDRALLEIYQEKHRRGFESLLKSLM